MKKIAILLSMVISLGMFAKSADAQVNVSINIGSQPMWGPVGYDYASYYYFPDIDAYYSISKRQFIYLNGNHWVWGSSLPGRYKYDLDRGYKVVINDPDPWTRAPYYRQQYGRYKGWYGKQTIIRNSNDPKYYQWNGRGPKGNNGHDNGNGHGRGNDNNQGHGNGHGHGHDRR
ncbi:hypothetical protein [Chitinophaga sp. Cy-1792]|uniref:hypothetical protein n=1 Tax=Chitinophaga sp. Cy-1792 TaxID=2608339 RepID=UPI001422B1A7|nr:hypothetical protein [Chitinophaga sp. Cy-1792]NIG53031.1 hypothetical protein [Chitinophaga sp. Cy-1792]